MARFGNHVGRVSLSKDGGTTRQRAFVCPQDLYDETKRAAHQEGVTWGAWVRRVTESALEGTTITTPAPDRSRPPIVDRLPSADDDLLDW